ncbi:BnaA04g27960D [Brassica napus]|uniref:BnaA04g27960D protein n=1 Tax=Brassica napus TaxID=3708 RepID=A0A078IR94_BRANA|nr:BnaA04g27960D [Brassica napus]
MINLLQSLKRSLAYAVIWMLFMILDCSLPFPQ